MEEKAIVNDVLESTKACLKDLEGAIIETANMELRQTFQNLRNSSESFQYELFKLAESKGYYVPAQNATQDENTVMIKQATNAEAREIKDYIENIILNRSKNQGTVVQQASPAEELKKFKELLDMGVISQEEFDAKKKQILGL